MNPLGSSAYPTCNKLPDQSVHTLFVGVSPPFLQDTRMNGESSEVKAMDYKSLAQLQQTPSTVRVADVAEATPVGGYLQQRTRSPSTFSWL